MITLIFMLLAASNLHAVEEETGSSVTQACSHSESWKFSSLIEPEFIESFELGMRNKMSPVQSFSEAIAYRKMASVDEAKAFSEYWISRSLHRAGLIHIAGFGWNIVAAREVNPRTEGAQRASLECLMEIRDKNPTLDIPDAVFGRLKDYPASHVRTRAAGVWARQILANGNRDGQLELAFTLMEQSSADYHLAMGMYELQKKSYPKAIVYLKNFLSVKKLPEHLVRFQESAQILLSRAYYSTGKYAEAASELKKISKSSNELAQSITELAWAHLKSDRLGEAVGAGISLQSGGLKRTWAPEGLMVMIMALNELCQYPQAIQAIALYKKQYEAPFKWLEANRDQNFDGYKLALDFIQKRNSVPPAVVTEWIRTPAFLSRQEEINLLIREKEAVAKLQKAGATELLDQAQQILVHIQKLRPKVISALETLKADDTLPENLRRDLSALREEINHYERLRKGAGPWKKILASHTKRVPVIQEKLVREIQDQIREKTKRMYTLLDEITDNLQLIEVEIYSGASQDIVWQNAHPDYKQKAKQLSQEAEANGRKPSTDWNWGRVDGGLAGQGEVWEDEVGSFKADIVDNCSSKEKYLKLKAQNN